MRDILTRGLAQLGLPADAVPQLEAYAALLLEKNKVMNLTAITARRRWPPCTCWTAPRC